MKNVMKSALTILLCLTFCVCLISCNDVEETGIWESATYLSDTELGEGAKQVKVVISGEDQSITLTVNTDEKTLGDALAELKLINNNNGIFDTVIGMKADYSKNQAWWKFCDAEGNPLIYGVFDAKINGGETFKFVYTIGF